MSESNVASIFANKHWPHMEMASIMQSAAEAGTETKRLIEPDPSAIYGEHRVIVVNGLRAIASGDYGKDYHGIRPSQADNLLRYFGVDQAAKQA